MGQFRFERFEVWVEARKVVNGLMDLSNEFRLKNHYSLADQLFRASLSITNNISEGAGSTSNKEFAHFLNISRRSAFECVNILTHAMDQGLISKEAMLLWKDELEGICRQLYAFRKYQLSKNS